MQNACTYSNCEIGSSGISTTFYRSEIEARGYIKAVTAVQGLIKFML